MREQQDKLHKKKNERECVNGILLIDNDIFH